ncbi:hypothetical protein LTR95_015325 [Oleoguttula sp. CCFEE 5521]
MEVPSLLSTTLDVPPSCIAFCPSHPEYFIVGTYFLYPSSTVASSIDAQETPDNDGTSHRERQQRSGSAVLYRYVKSVLTPVCTLSLPSAAVLDIAWSPFANRDVPLLCVATSTGTLEFYNLILDALPPTLARTAVHGIADADALILDVVFHPSNAGIIGATVSNGDVVVCRSHDKTWEQASSVSVKTIAHHSLEPWTLTFSNDGQNLFSGGDDAMVQCIEIGDLLRDEDSWGSSQEDDETGMPAPLWSDRRAHGAGVTALLPITVEHDRKLLLTGSYDDHIRLLSMTGKGRREVIAELNLGGGVWRLELIKLRQGADEKTRGSVSDRPTAVYTLLVSCMHAGARIVQLSQRTGDGVESHWEFEVQAQFTEHKSMNYGTAVQPLATSLSADRESVDPAIKQRTIVSTSFYDKLLCVWNVDV